MATLAELIVKIGADLGHFEKHMNKVDRMLRQAGERWSSIGQRLTTGLTLPLLAVGGGASRVAIGFESAFTGVRKTVDATEAELDQIRRGIRDMAKKEVPLAAAAIAGVAETAGQLGIQVPNILKFTRVMVDLGETTDLTARGGAEALAQFANITQMPQTEFDRLGSTVVALGNKLATTESRIVDMGLRLAGAGAQVGLTEAQILALAGAAASVGIESEAGGSAFSRVMVDIASEVASGGKNLALFAKVAGKSADQFAEAWRKDAAGALVDFLEGLGALGEQGVNVFAVLDELGLSEIRVRDALLRASGAGDLFRRAMELGSRAWEENTALAREAEQRYATTESRLRILWNRIVDVGISLGDALAPAIEKVTDAAGPLIDKLGEAARWFADLDPGMQQMIVSGLAALAALGPVAYAIGNVVKAVSGLVAVARTILVVGTWATRVAAAFAAWSAGTGTLGAALTALVGGPVGWVLLAMAALVVAGYLLIRNWDTIKAAALDTWGRIKAALADAGAWVVERWGSVMATLLDGFGRFVLFFYDAWGKLKAFLTDTLARILDSVAGFLELFNQEAAAAARRYSSVLRDLASDERRLIDERRRALADLTRTVESEWARQAQAIRDYAEAERRLIEQRREYADWLDRAQREAAGADAVLLGTAQRITEQQRQAAEAARQAAAATQAWADSLKEVAEIPEVAISDAGLVATFRALERARAIGNAPGEQMALSILEAAQALRRPAAAAAEVSERSAIPTAKVPEEVEVHHTGTLRVEGVNDRRQLVGAVEIIARDLEADQDRYPMSTSVRRTWK